MAGTLLVMRSLSTSLIQENCHSEGLLPLSQAPVGVQFFLHVTLSHSWLTLGLYPNLNLPARDMHAVSSSVLDSVCLPVPTLPYTGIISIFPLDAAHFEPFFHPVAYMLVDCERQCVV